MVGHKNTSITWTVPSNNKPVEPFKDPHWSSSLGEARIVDFRIQVANAENFKATKAHWYASDTIKIAYIVTKYIILVISPSNEFVT